MLKVRFRCREMVKIKFLDSNVVPGSTIYGDTGTHLTSQNQDVDSLSLRRHAHGPLAKLQPSV